jgi:hypothetical protein
MSDLPGYFYVDKLAYRLERFEPRYCSLHGEPIGYQVVGRKIKSSGRLGNTKYVYGVKHLNIDCRQLFDRHIEKMTAQEQ